MICACFPLMQERLVFESGQLWASTLMSHPDKIRKIQVHNAPVHGVARIDPGAPVRCRTQQLSCQKYSSFKWATRADILLHAHRNTWRL